MTDQCIRLGWLESVIHEIYIEKVVREPNVYVTLVYCCNYCKNQFTSLDSVVLHVCTCPDRSLPIRR